MDWDFIAETTGLSHGMTPEMPCTVERGIRQESHSYFLIKLYKRFAIRLFLRPRLVAFSALKLAINLTDSKKP
jgi:hypothetical protein